VVGLWVAYQEDHLLGEKAICRQRQVVHQVAGHRAEYYLAALHDPGAIRRLGVVHQPGCLLAGRCLAVMASRADRPAVPLGVIRWGPRRAKARCVPDCLAPIQVDLRPDVTVSRADRPAVPLDVIHWGLHRAKVRCVPDCLAPIQVDLRLAVMASQDVLLASRRDVMVSRGVHRGDRRVVADHLAPTPANRPTSGGCHLGLRPHPPVVYLDALPGGHLGAGHPAQSQGEVQGVLALRGQFQAGHRDGADHLALRQEAHHPCAVGHLDPIQAGHRGVMAIQGVQRAARGIQVVRQAGVAYQEDHLLGVTALLLC